MAADGGSLLGALVLVALLSTSVPAEADTDLSALLAAPPGADWIEAGATATVIDGPITAKSYAAFLVASGGKSSIESELNRDGFTGGYGRSWEQRGSQDTLIERVFQFGNTVGAGYWYDNLKTTNRTMSEYSGDLDSSSIPDSFGVVLTTTDGDREFRIEFVKGDFVFVVHLNSLTNDLSAATLTQARLQYASAATVTPGAPAAGAHNLAAWVVPASISIVALVALAFVVSIVGLLIRSRRRRPFITSGVQWSPDGSFWWDGGQWRSAATDVPPTAMRSPDGSFWWDGRAWRPVPVLRRI
jgi:hypothetical protein